MQFAFYTAMHADKYDHAGCEEWLLMATSRLSYTLSLLSLHIISPTWQTGILKFREVASFVPVTKPHSISAQA